MSKSSSKREIFTPDQISKIHQFFCDLEGEIGGVPDSKYSGYSAIRAIPSPATKHHYIALKDSGVFKIATEIPISTSSKDADISLVEALANSNVRNLYLNNVVADYCYYKLSKFQNQRLESPAPDGSQPIKGVARREFSSAFSKTTLFIKKDTKSGKVTICKENKKGQITPLTLESKELTSYIKSLLQEVDLIEQQQESLQGIFRNHPFKNKETRVARGEAGEFTITNKDGTLIIYKNGAEIDHRDESSIAEAFSCFLNHNARESEKIAEDTAAAKHFITQCSAIASQIGTDVYDDPNQAKKDYKLLVKSLPKALEILLQGPSDRTDESAKTYNKTLQALDKAAKDVANLIGPLASSAGLGFACAHDGHASEDLSQGDLKNIRSQIAKIIYSTDDQKLIESAAGILQAFHQVDNEASYRSDDVYNLTRSNADYVRTLSLATIDSAAGHYQHRDEADTDNSAARLDMLISSLTSQDPETPKIPLKTALDCEEYFGNLAKELGPDHPLIVAHRVSNQGYAEGLYSNLVQEINDAAKCTGNANDGLPPHDPNYIHDGSIDAIGHDRTCHLKIIESADGQLKLINKTDFDIAFRKIGDYGFKEVYKVSISTLVSTSLTGEDRTPRYSFHIGDIEPTQFNKGYEQEVVAKMSRYFAAMRQRYQETSQAMLNEFETAKLSSLNQVIGNELELPKIGAAVAADKTRSSSSSVATPQTPPTEKRAFSTPNNSPTNSPTNSPARPGRAKQHKAEKLLANVTNIERGGAARCWALMALIMLGTL